MNLISESVSLSPRRIRGLAIALFTVISVALWTSFSADTYFASDGSFYFAIILDNGTFTNVAPSRAHAEYLTQWPLVLAVHSGVTDLEALEIFFGLGIWFPWVLSFAISLYATRERPALVFFLLISMSALTFHRGASFMVSISPFSCWFGLSFILESCGAGSRFWSSY